MFGNIKDKIDTFQAKRFENYVKKLSESDKMRDIEKFKKLMNSGKLNLEDEKILNYVITWHAHRFLSKLDCSQKEIKVDFETGEWCGKFSYEAINSLLKKEIPIEKIMQNSEIERELINSFLMLKNSELTIKQFEHPLFMAPKLEVMGEIIKIPKYKEIIQNGFDVQTYGERFFYRKFKGYKKYLEMYKKCAAFLLELGYVPCRHESEFAFLTIWNKWSIEYQNYYNDLGLIDKSLTSRLYQNLFNMYQNHYFKEPTYFISSALIVDEQDKMSLYWKKASNLLNTDSMFLIWSEVHRAANFLFNDEEAKNKFKKQQFTDGIPNTLFFNGEVVNQFIERIVKYKVNRELAQFLFLNLDQIKGSNKGFFKVLQKLENVPKELKNDLIQNFLFWIGSVSKKDKYFDEKGVTSIFYEDVKYNVCNQTLPYIDSEWKQHYTPEDENFIKYTIKCPKLFNFKYFTNINRFFDENGLTQEFYDYAINHVNFCACVSKLESDWTQHFSGEPLRMIEFFSKYPQYVKELLKVFKDDLSSAHVVFGQRTSDEKIIALLQYGELYNFYLIEYLKNNNKFIQDEFCTKFCTFIKNSNYKNILSIFLELGKSDIFKLFFEVLSEEEVNAILKEVTKIENEYLQRRLIEYFVIHPMSFNEFTIYVNLIMQIEHSNALEISNFKDTIVQICLLDNDPLERFKKLESIFLKNNLPTIGKIFSVFKFLHPHYDFDFDFSEFSKISPMLKYQPTNLKKANIWGENVWRDIIIFSDLIRAAVGSNNKSIKNYIENLEIGNQLFLDISSKFITYEQLDDYQKEVMKIFVNYLNTLYNNTVTGKSETNILSGDTIKDIQHLVEVFSPNGTVSYHLPDRIVKMYFHFAGFDTLDELKTYLKEKIQKADVRNRKFAEQEVTLEVGDFIKGIKGIDYLHNILQNGSLAKEFLGANADGDSTPLDTDLSRVLERKENIKQMIFNTPSQSFGPIYFLIKNDERFFITRDFKDECVSEKYNREKIEIFCTSSGDHYGIRTGFASSEINCILMEEYDKRVGLEIALNGFYIPVADFSGKVIFTPNDYDILRSKMAGLSYYEEEHYSFSKEIDCISVDSILEEQEKGKEELVFYQKKIYQAVQNVLQKYDLDLKTNISNDLSNGFVELLDTGSTGRETYVPGDIDFDFVMRLDRSTLLDHSIFENLKQDLLQAFHQKDESDVIDGQFRLKKAYVEGIDAPVKIDITFTQKTDKVSYTTDLAIQDCLGTIKKQEERKYKQVLGNIVLAKQILKQANVYKPSRKDPTQGGLGGIGIETWILQNGGSFIEAAKSFIRVAEGKNFDEFKKEYFLWDFGSNFLAESRGFYPHDNFVDHMNEMGYKKMKEVLENYLFTLNNNSSLDVERADVLSR